ncbi:DUF4397 domain-containing protein [Chitinophaga nivalis]|uniref:DUF4397 domain-containing protein n=1 Tax=Chitinophaga nivalis TaxID=2991709 RepID=A0ABT3IH68_9BACT|nr:DUF4397 domain-containing protein [Chitinophaga nivalis]MCW3467013.1 DUF4397 domain-containing protein [Chitinophaga nivalis]MCW3483296.1 DUF4397 domain-containing protein [Chitinophaga nivalis]
MKYRSFLCSFVLVLFLVLSSCSKSNNNSDPGSAQLMVANLIVGTTGIDVTVNGKKLNDAAVTFTNSSGYKSTTAGRGTITIYQANTSNVVLSKEVDFVNGKNYSLLLYDVYTNTKSAFVEDDIITGTPGKSYIRFFNLVSSSTPVKAGTVTVAGFTPIFVNRSYETEATAQANDGYTAISAGTYGLFSVQSSTRNYAKADITFEEGKVYTVVYYTYLTGPPLADALQIYINK